MRRARGLALLLLAAAAFPASAATYTTVGIKAHDGDSILVRFPSGLEVETRLLSIDCPEKDQRFADEARSFTHGRIAGKTVRLDTGEDQRDRYGRLLAFATVDGTLLNEELIAQGLAVAYVVPPNTDRVDVLLAAQEEAHRAGRGVWGAEPPIEEPRAARARGRDRGLPFQPLRYENHLLLGNRRSRVAHWPGCRHGEEIAAGNLVLFGRVSEALGAGFRMEKGFR
jgi:endonuclease YncB( thermonuclease family)